MNITNIPLSELKPNPNNPRVITSVMMDKLKKSIQEFPEMLNVRPIILDSNNVILGGNMRYKALQSLGYTEAPCIYANQLTPEEQQDLLIKNNLSYGDWDWEDILTNWQLESVRDWGLDVPGFFFDDDVEPEIEVQEDFNRIKTIAINLDRDHYTKMLDELNGIVRREGLSDYSDAVLFLINNYEDN
jgi:ParB-like chromosome segregation protein Spo0J